MPGVRQYYDGPGVPLVVPVTPAEVAECWREHRARLHGWFRRLPAPAWGGPTRCSDWSVEALARHLISGSQFLGYTLHQARKGEPTRLLADFDPQSTPVAAASLLASVETAALSETLEAADRRVAEEINGFRDSDWLLPAEAPPGRVPAFVSVNHFLFDSWVHERDLLIPAGEAPPVIPAEASAVVSYVVALAGVAQFANEEPPTSSSSLEVRARDVGVSLSVRREQVTTVAFGPAPPGAPVVEGPAGEIVDFATGRVGPQRLEGDPAGLAYLSHLADVMG